MAGPAGCGAQPGLGQDVVTSIVDHSRKTAEIDSEGPEGTCQT